MINFPHIYHGGDYNPEQWDESVWREDVRLMREANWNIATLPVFGWVHLQPSEEVFHFEWLDRVLDLLHENGIAACLATATASVPAWVTQKYPDVLRVEENGVRRKHGNRHTFCPNSPNFQRLSTQLARKIGERYATHPAVKMWHVSNEYGSNCYCDLCAEAFRNWAKARYGTMEELNARWYLHFWGATLTDWSQIETPTLNGQRVFQGMLLDYDRFGSESLLRCFREEAKILREIAPSIPITTNMMGAYKPLDYHAWAQEIDIISWDSYPPRGAKPSDIAFNHSLMRGLKEGAPWMLMEQTPSQQNWQSYNSLKRPGVMRLWSLQAVAHGADAVMYFQWRRSRGACEKYHGAVVEHVGTSAPRVFQEVKTLGDELEHLATKTLGSRVRSRVAMLFSWENWWAIEYSVGPSVALKYVPICQEYFAALHDQNIACDIVSPDADLSGYDIVVAPVLYLCEDETARKLEEFVARGGTFITTYFSGIVDKNDLVHLGGYPGPLRKLLGVWAEEIDALAPDESNSVVLGESLKNGDNEYSCGLLCDRVHAEGAEVLANYGSEFYAGEPAITVNNFGEGKAFYFATQIESRGLYALLGKICAQAGVSAVLPTPQGVEVTERVATEGASTEGASTEGASTEGASTEGVSIEGVSAEGVSAEGASTEGVSAEGQSQIYLLNHNAHSVEIALPHGDFVDLLTNAPHQNFVQLPAYGVAILQVAP